jgi:hypothetical protein
MQIYARLVLRWVISGSKGVLVTIIDQLYLIFSRAWMVHRMSKSSILSAIQHARLESVLIFVYNTPFQTDIYSLVEVPVRSTSHTHLRDGFIRAIQSRITLARNSGYLSQEEEDVSG